MIIRLAYVFAVAMLLSAFCVEANAAKVTLRWDASPDPSVVGYRVYWQPEGTATLWVLDVGKATMGTIPNLVEGLSYAIFTTAYDAKNIESQPSNEVSYTVPFATLTGFSLRFGGFTHGTSSHMPRGVMTTRGELYAAGSRVELSATGESGYMCTAWMVNGDVIPGNPVIVTMDQDMLVVPLMFTLAGEQAMEPATSISLKIEAKEGEPVISVGGELGQWVLEGSTLLPGNWTQVAQGVTSEQITVKPSVPFASYRVRAVAPPIVEEAAGAIANRFSIEDF